MVQVAYTLLADENVPITSKNTTKLWILVFSGIISLLLIKSFLIQQEGLAKDTKIAAAKPDPGVKIFNEFYKCMYLKLAPLAGKYDEFWFQFANLTEKCDSLEVYKALDLRPAKNLDEIKFVAYPKNNETLTMVTLGIGHDVSGELKLKQMYPKIDFFGADPSSYMNKDLYEKKLGGDYFEYAVSGQSGRNNSRVFRKGGYHEELTQTIGVDSFLRKAVNRTKIDIFWIDIEGHEYPILEQIHKNGTLEQNGVKICQMNVEMHRDTFKQSQGEPKKFHDFVFKILEDKKYIMLKPVFVKFMTRRFIRTFIVNISDEECVNSFIK